MYTPGITRMNSPSHESLPIQEPPSPIPEPIITIVHQPNPLKGFLLLACGLFLFSCLDCTTKYLVARYNVPTVAAMRYVTHCLLMLAIVAPRYPAHLIKTQRTGLVILRAFTLTLTTLFVGLALQMMPLAETTSIIFIAPMFVVLLASPLLGEKVGTLGWVAVITGFIGVLLVVRPGSDLSTLGIFFALLGAMSNAAYQLMSRILVSTEKAVTMLFYTALLGTIIFGIALPWFWENKTPTSMELMLFVLLGVFGGLGHYFFTLAYRHASASSLAPVTYLQLLWAGLLGWLIFDSTPHGLSILGMVIVAGSGVMIALKYRFIK